VNARDFDYIETRLLAPCSDALDAHERLRQHEPELAAALMAATQTFTDECRTIRHALTERRRAS
jgi:hypothetical protein